MEMVQACKNFNPTVISFLVIPFELLSNGIIMYEQLHGRSNQPEVIN